jgi:hypothetical protein
MPRGEAFVGLCLTPFGALSIFGGKLITWKNEMTQSKPNASKRFALFSKAVYWFAF